MRDHVQQWLEPEVGQITGYAGPSVVLLPPYVGPIVPAGAYGPARVGQSGALSGGRPNR